MSTTVLPPRLCAAGRRCRQPITLALTQGSWTSWVCDKHAGVVLSRRLDPAGTRWGRLPMMVRPVVDGSLVTLTHDCAHCPDCKGSTCCQRTPETDAAAVERFRAGRDGSPQVPQVG